MTKEYTQSAIELLQRLISIPSESRDEQAAADQLQQTMESYGLSPRREGNNLWVENKGCTDGLPTILLNAHIDTVRPVASWSRNPYTAEIEDGKLFGLGSNDCGGGLVSLLQVFRFLSERPQHYNLIYLASAEEEVSGTNGICRVLPLLPSVDVAIVGEPTGMQPAIAEKGLMVIDLIAKGKSGHAARSEGVNAIYKMLDDLTWLRDYRFKRVSELLGPTLMNVTMVNAGTQHNVVPDKCTAVVDIRTNARVKMDVFDTLYIQASYPLDSLIKDSIRLKKKTGIEQWEDVVFDIAPRDSAEDLAASIKTLGFSKFATLSGFITALYCILFFAIEAFNFFDILMWLARWRVRWLVPR